MADNKNHRDSERYRALFSATREGLLVVDDNGIYVEVNEAYASLLKSTPAEVIGRHFSEFMPADRLAEAEASFALMRTGGPGLREFPLRAVDGTLVPCEWTVRPHFLPGLSLCAARDITERKAAEESLRASEGRFRAAISAVSSILWTNNAAGQMVGDQPGWAAFTGQTYEEYRGYGWSNAVHPEDAQPTIEAWTLAVSERRMFVFEHRVRRKDGVHRLFSIRAVPVLNNAGAVIEWVGVHTDITEERALTEALRQNERQLRFLVELDDATRSLTDAVQIMETAVRLFGEHLEADGVAYCHFDSDGETFHTTGDYTRPGVASLKGDYVLSQFGEALAQSLRNNKVYLIEDIEADPRTSAGVRPAYRAMGLRASMAVPLHKAGRLVAAVGVHQLMPRKWQPHEVELLLQVANRCWESIERARTETHLRHQWQLFDTALSNTPDNTFSFDLDGRLTYVNRGLLSLWRKPLEDVLGKTCSELGYPPELAQRLDRQIRQVIETHAPVRDEAPFTDSAGRTGHYEYIFAPVVGASGRVEGVVGSSRDITDREQMARALAVSEQKLQDLFTQAPVAIAVFRGRDLVIELANPFYAVLLRGRELLGHRLRDVAPELEQYVWEAINRVLDTGEPFTASEWHVAYDQDGDGQVEDHWFNVAFHPMREVDNAVCGMVAVLTDVTVQVRARQDVERVNRELEEFAYVSSHDLQEPLRMIGIYTELLLRRYLPENEQAKRYGAFIGEGVHRMERLIRDLLTYSRVIHSEGPNVGIADLNESLRQALETLRNRIQEEGAEVVATGLPVVRGDSTQLAHVFQNLLANSLKYRDASRPPAIRISAERAGSHWVICVEDNGIGFEQRYAERIFGLFKRLHKNEYSGTGLGLAICQRILERYGGRIRAEGRLGVGAKFFVTLPEVGRE